MQLSDSNLKREYQWKVYQQLELLPDSVPHPASNTPKFRFGVDAAWRSLISLLVDELVDREQQEEYLERCWTSDKSKREVRVSTLQRLLTLMK